MMEDMLLKSSERRGDMCDEEGMEMWEYMLMLVHGRSDGRTVK